MSKYTEAQAEALRKALARGATRLRMGGEEVQFESLAAMRRQLAVIEADLEGRAPNALGVSYLSTGRGL